MKYAHKLTLVSHCSLEWVLWACILSWHDCESKFGNLHALPSVNIKDFQQMHLIADSCQQHTCFLLCRYSNQVVAKLPFEPHWILAKVAHRGLKFPEANDCAVVRSSILCVMSASVNLLLHVSSCCTS